MGFLSLEIEDTFNYLSSFDCKLKNFQFTFPRIFPRVFKTDIQEFRHTILQKMNMFDSQVFNISKNVVSFKLLLNFSRINCNHLVSTKLGMIGLGETWTRPRISKSRT